MRAMTRWVRGQGISTLILLLCALPAIATDHAKHESATSRTTLAGPTDAEITKLVWYRIVRQRRAHGAVLAILRPEGRSIVAFHDPSTFGEPPPDANTIFEIASLSKIFTALLLAEDR